MIGPVSTTGRAMMQSLQQAMQKGMPADQAIQYVKGMATQGVAPLADLYSMMNQFQRLKQQQVQPPQTPPTIKDQLNMAEQQQMQQQQAMQGGIAGMQAPAPAPQPMDRGLGAIDAGRMEYPQFAGGGVVALASGGPPPPYEFNDDLEAQVPSYMDRDMDIVSFVRAQMPNFDALSPEQKQQVLKQFEPVYMRARSARNTLVERGRASNEAPKPGSVNFTEAGGIIPAANPFDEGAPPAQQVVPVAKPEAKPVAERRPAAPKTDRFSQFEIARPDLAEIRKEREERQKATKTGAYSQADADLAAYIKEQKDQGGDEKQAYRNFWVMTGAALMSNKSPSFLGALGESVKENYGGLVKDLKALKDDAKQLRLQEIQLRRAEEQAIESGSREDQQRYDTLFDRYQSTNYNIEKARSDIEQKVLERNHESALANLRSGGKYDMADMATKLWLSAEAETDPAKKKALLDQYQRTLVAGAEITRANTAGGAGAASREEIAVANAVQKRKEQNDYKRNERVYYSDSSTPEQKAAAKARMDEMERKAANDAANILGVPVSGTSGYGPSTSSGVIDFNSLT